MRPKIVHFKIFKNSLFLKFRAKEILKFRDQAFVEYHKAADFQQLIGRRFGLSRMVEVRKNEP